MTLKQQIELHKKAEKAMRSAVRKVVEEHKRSGTPLVVWKNGRVQYIRAQKLKFNLKAG